MVKKINNDFSFKDFFSMNKKQKKKRKPNPWYKINDENPIKMDKLKL